MMLASLLLLAALQHAPAEQPTPAPLAPAGQAAEQHASPDAAHAPEASHGAAHDPGAVLMHHVLDQPFLGLWSKHLVFFVIAALSVLVFVRMAISSYKHGGVPRGVAAAVESLVLFVRDDIAEANIGHDGRKFTSLLCSFFFFILFAALLGLLPFSATSTGNLSVTLALATISFFAQQWAGISKFGVVHHFMNLVPSGLPVWLLPIMIPVEILSMFTKPFALMFRLFANMLAGHMVITALLMLIPLMAGINGVLGIAVMPVSLGLSLFIMMLEVLVAFIQAYIFTLLTAIFIGMYAHPAH